VTRVLWDDVPDDVKDQLSGRKDDGVGTTAIVDSGAERWYFTKVPSGWNHVSTGDAPGHGEEPEPLPRTVDLESIEKIAKVTEVPAARSAGSASRVRGGPVRIWVDGVEIHVRSWNHESRADVLGDLKLGSPAVAHRNEHAQLAGEGAVPQVLGDAYSQGRSLELRIGRVDFTLTCVGYVTEARAWHSSETCWEVDVAIASSEIIFH